MQLVLIDPHATLPSHVTHQFTSISLPPLRDSVHQMASYDKSHVSSARPPKFKFNSIKNNLNDFKVKNELKSHPLTWSLVLTIYLGPKVPRSFKVDPHKKSAARWPMRYKDVPPSSKYKNISEKYTKTLLAAGSIHRTRQNDRNWSSHSTDPRPPFWGRRGGGGRGVTPSSSKGL